MPWIIRILIILGALAAAAFFGANWYAGRMLSLPPHEKVELAWTEQNWKPDDWNWFYHTPQGGALESVIPYQWFMNLEQPRLSIGSAGRLVDPEYIQRFGFLPSAKSQYNPDGLPVGFARTNHYLNPEDGRTDDVIGFTCALCHTGQVNFKGKGVRVEGGPALTNLDKFRKAIGISLLVTRYDPFRFSRFATAVLGPDATAEAKTALKDRLAEILTKGKQGADLNSKLHLYPVEEGFGRLDALGRIGNFVFGHEVSTDNLLPATAPVGYPHIWNTPWFEWVQYNGSIKQPMIRNAGEAMGVFARVNFNADSPQLFDSTIDVAALSAMEERIRGANVFEPGQAPRFRGLDAPKWPEHILGNIDRAKAARGKDLYKQYCSGCHLPAPNTPEFFDTAHWTDPDSKGRRYLKLKMLDLADIGTDPSTALNWYKAVVNLGPLGQKLKEDVNKRMEPFLGLRAGGAVTPAGVALPLLVEKAVENRYRKLNIPQDQWDDMNGNRPNDVRAPLAYKARPLNGVWATAPFLHNGSIPTVYQMLVPAARRDARFHLGGREYDPVHLGFSTAAVEGAFLLDTSIPGNHNTGHEFSASREKWTSIVASGVYPLGVIGPELTDDERWALVEYLKTL